MPQPIKVNIKPNDPAAIPTAIPPPKCMVTDQPDGAMAVQFLISPEIASRLRRRANTMPMDRYLWENILYRSIVDGAY